MAEHILTKFCPRCKEVKPITAFGVRRSRKSGIYSYCKACAVQSAMAYRRSEKGKATAKAWLKTPAGREYAKRFKKNNPEKVRRHYRESKLRCDYGMTLEDYAERLRLQGGRCAICRTTNPGKAGSFHVDHDHQTGRVRGLLCKKCNLGIGMLGDNLKGLMAAVAYLRKHEAAFQVPDARKARHLSTDAGQIPLFAVA